MKKPIVIESPPQQEIEQLRARIAQLEKELASAPRRPESQWFDEGDLTYKEVFDNISVCMFLVDVAADGRFKYAGFNAAEEEAVGLTTAEVTGKFVEDVFDPELAAKLTANYRRCLETGSPITYDDELNMPAGQRYFHSNLIPIRNASGKIYRIVGACIDTTDFKRTQEQALATQKLESLGLLAGGIAHDLNNLLGSIVVESEFLMEELDENPTAREGLTRIDAVADRASEIVRQLMVYAGQESAGFEQVDLVGLVREMIQLISISTSKNGKLQVDLPNKLLVVRANPTQIRQVILNLVTNASEALQGNQGLISVRINEVRSEEVPSKDPSSKPSSGSYLRLEVTDTGCGMPPEVQARMFDPFFTTKGIGRGLGLAAAQGIIRGHGGKMNVVSAPGRGSRFEILLPWLVEPEVGSGEGPALARGAGAFTGTVLVVDDEEPLRLAVSKMLRQRGFSVHEAGDGKSGVELFRAYAAQIDAVLLDVTLPGLSGKEVLAEMQKIRPDVKVILTSAYGPECTLLAVGQERPQPYIRKPYRLGELTDLIRKTCLNEV